MFSQEELEKLERAFSKMPSYETSSGFTGNVRQGQSTTEKKSISAVKRKIADFTADEKRQWWHLQHEFVKMWERHSMITPKKEGKKTKKDFKVKGQQRVEGIWSISQYETYSKRNVTFLKFCFENYGIRRLRELRPQMVGEFVQMQIEKKNSGKTIDSYLNAFQKLAEIGRKDGIKSFGMYGKDGKFYPKLVNDKHKVMYEKYSKAKYRRGKGCYTQREARIMAKAARKHFSELHGLLIDVLAYAGPRNSEIRRLKWNHLDFENSRIMMVEANLTKGNRPRFVPIPQKVMERFKEVKGLGLHGNDNKKIWGNRMSEQDLRNFVRECARLGHVKYSAVHDFRRTAIEYWDTHLEKRGYTKEQLIEMFMAQVNVDERLNPLISVKTNGVEILERKYTPERIREYQIRKLRNMLASQMLGHNRTDITAVYRKSKET